MPVIAEPELDKDPGMKTPTFAPRQILDVLNLLLMASLPCVATTGCMDDSADSEHASAEGQLLFDITEAELLAIHDNYLPDEDLELTRARLTAPFDCALYDDLCEQVGRDAAIEITARQVDLALEGAGIEEIETELEGWISEASAARRELEDGQPEAEVEHQFRSSGDWAIRTKGDYRLKVRNGVTTPLIGQRQAWTEVKLQHQDIFGIWSGIEGTEVCVNTGVNEQVVSIGGGGQPTTDTTIESFNPSMTCAGSTNSNEDETFHERNSGWEAGGMWSTYTITARGCGNAEVNGVFLGICAEDHSAAF